MMPGMPDLSQLLMQAQQMQADMVRAQASLSETEVTGSAGGGAVTAVVNGAGDLLRVRIDPAVVDPSDVETLEDLVVAAVHDARRAAEKVASEAMGSVAGGLDLSAMGLPPGLGLPGGGFGGAVENVEYDEDEYDEDDDEDDDEADFADSRAIDEETDEVYRREFEQEQLDQGRRDQGAPAGGGREPGGPAPAGTPGPATSTGT